MKKKLPPACQANDTCKGFVNPDGTPICDTDISTDCNDADDCYFQEAELSDFHDEYLIAATKKIRQVVKDILAEIPAAKQGRKLSFLFTGKGVLLAWVNHRGERLPGAIGLDNGYEAYEKALKIIKPR
jgi:hypothetical protein